MSSSLAEAGSCPTLLEPPPPPVSATNVGETCQSHISTFAQVQEGGFCLAFSCLLCSAAGGLCCFVPAYILSRRFRSILPGATPIAMHWQQMCDGIVYYFVISVCDSPVQPKSQHVLLLPSSPLCMCMTSCYACLAPHRQMTTAELAESCAASCCLSQHTSFVLARQVQQEARWPMHAVRYFAEAPRHVQPGIVFGCPAHTRCSQCRRRQCPCQEDAFESDTN